MEVGGLGKGGPISIDYITGNQIKSGQTEMPTADRTQIKIQSDNQEAYTPEDVSKAVDKLNKFIEGENVHVVYEKHDKLKDIMIKIVDNDTQEVVLEIPPKKILDMVAKMMETVGILLDKKA